METYLSADEPRWSPTSAAEIQQAIDAGLLRETHYLDMKRESGSTSGERKETARDLASFAIDGGALLIGVAEDKEKRTFELAPQPLEGLVEKLEQIASLVLDPPLTIVSREIESGTGDGNGFVLVAVPPSPLAPHMVDNKYYGRGEKTRQSLSDAEVLRLHASRTSTEERVEVILDKELERDPLRDHSRGHLYLIAQPLRADRRVARTFVRGNTIDVMNLAHGIDDLLGRDIREFAPQPREMTSIATRSNGVAVTSYGMSGPGRTVRDPNVTYGSHLDMEFRDDGGIRIFVDRMTDEWGRANSAVVLDGLAVAYALRIVHWAAKLGDRIGYRGSWLFGLHGSGLRGLYSHKYVEHWDSGPAYDEDFYRETTSAADLEVRQRPEAVAERLAGRLLDGLGTRTAYDKHLVTVEHAGQT